MKIGGYQIIDLKGKNLTTDVGMVYEGIYELIEGTRKPILLSGIQVDDIEYQDVFTSVTINGSAFELRAYNRLFTIEDTDVVTVTNDIDGGAGDGSSTDGITRFTIYVNESAVERRYECEAPANKTWRECIINNLIKSTSIVDENDDSYNYTLKLGIGSNDVILPITLGSSNLIYCNFNSEDTSNLNTELYDYNSNPVKDTDIIEEAQYTNFADV